MINPCKLETPELTCPNPSLKPAPKLIDFPDRTGIILDSSRKLILICRSGNLFWRHWRENNHEKGAFLHFWIGYISGNFLYSGTGGRR